MRIGAFRVAIAGLLVFAGCAQESATVAEDKPRSTSPRAGAGTTMVSGSCVEQYSLDTLKKRDYAFDGTVNKIDPGTESTPDRATFAVNKWFKGGAGATTVRRAHSFSGVSSARRSPRRVGERLLVAGDDDFVWECGFTQPYDANVAAEWERNL